jgi:hypothetical protein
MSAGGLPFELMFLRSPDGQTLGCAPPPGAPPCVQKPVLTTIGEIGYVEKVQESSRA